MLWKTQYQNNKANARVLQEADHTKNTDVSVFTHIQRVHLMYSEVAWVQVPSTTQFQTQIVLDADYFPDYFSISFGYVSI